MKCDSCYLERESVKHRYYGICLCDDCHLLPRDDFKSEPPRNTPLDDLRLLKQQIDSAISLVREGDLVPLTEQERIAHARRYGVQAFVIGDFVITKRKKYDFT